MTPAIEPALSRRLLYLLPAVAALVVYARTVGFELIPTWDDGSYILRNPLVTDFGLHRLVQIFSQPVMGHYSPLQILSYAADHALWGLDPAGYHLGNVLLHAVNAALIHVLLLRLAVEPRVALFAALMFAVHPLNVENVAWVAERKTMLSTLFFALALLVYLRWRCDGGRWRYALVLALGTAAMLSKSTAVVLPVVVLLHEIVLAGPRRRLLPALPLLAVAAFATWMTLGAHVGNRSFEAGLLSVEGLLGTVYPTAVTLWWKYLGLLVAPLDLSGYYDATVHHSFFDLPVLAALAGWIAVFWLVLSRGSDAVRFWFLWFWVCFAPVSNVIPINTFYADRYMYLPAVGLFVLAGIGLSAAARRLAPALEARAFVAVAVVLCLAFAALAWSRSEVWRDELSFWSDTAAKSPDLYKPRLNFGVALERAGRLAEAEREYAAAAALWPAGEAATYLRAVRFKRARIEAGPQVDGPDPVSRE